MAATGARPSHRSGPPPSPPAATSRRRLIASLAVISLGLGAVALFAQDLLLTGRAGHAEPARPLTTQEATRLADMRHLNHQQPHATVRATIEPAVGQPVRWTGWVDWQHPAVYLGRSGAHPGEFEELLQAVPGLVASRIGATHAPGVDRAKASRTGGGDPADASTTPMARAPYPPPPQRPPTDGWSLRRPGADGPAAAATDPASVDALVMLLLTITAERADSVELLAGSEARWLRRDRVAGYDVDVILGPAVPPTPPAAGPTAPGRTLEASLSSMGGAVQYWLDEHGQLHRLEALITEDITVRVDLDRADPTPPVVLAALGGAAVRPRPVTDQEAEALARMRQRNREAGGGELSVTIPGADRSRRRAAGWLDWQQRVAYLATYRDGAPDGLIWADGTGVATRSDHPPRHGQPPLPAPTDDGWQWHSWESRGDELGGYDLDLLLNEALSLSDWQVDQVAPLRESARWLRADTLHGQAVSVYEIPRPVESGAAPGEARLRYWLDDQSGVLLRLELRTRFGGFGQLDIRPGPPPSLR